METWQIIAIGVAVFVIAAAVGLWIYQRNRSRHLQQRFGPEYDRRIAETGDRRRAEAELAQSEARVSKLKVRDLSFSERSRFNAEWRLCQARFVDDPSGAVDNADRLVGEVMQARGYEVANPDQRVADVCAAYPGHAYRYRQANDVVVQHRRGQASTEDLRRAFVNFRTLFDEMLGGEDEELRRVS